ncbi:MAG: hypothetical protein OXH69_06435, partial [Acidobacteria bacterium]|nr:hypothetical protein [Acidobacteriota bacterium]
ADAHPGRRPGPTEWDRRADAIDRAESALLDALDSGDAERVRTAEDHLAQCQRRAGRLRARTAPAAPPSVVNPPTEVPGPRRAAT